MVCDGSLYSAAVAARGLSAAACKAASVSRHSQKGDLRTRRGDGSPASGTPSRRSARISKIDMTMVVRLSILAVVSAFNIWSITQQLRHESLGTSTNSEW